MKQTIKKILNNTYQNKIGVLGDLCVDFYWDQDSSITQRSLQTNMLAHKATNPRYSFGGGGNVIQNLLGLNCKPLCMGAISTDPFGLWLSTNLPNNKAILSTQNYHTAVYCKPIINNIEQPRIDFGNVELQNQDADKLIDIIQKNIVDLDIIVINQQLKKGIHTQYFRQKLQSLIKKYNNKKFIVDAREHLNNYIGSIFKINTKAASMFVFNDLTHGPIEAGKILNQKYNMPLVITDSTNGCYVFENNTVKHINCIPCNGQTDAIGAGDSFTAGLAYALSIPNITLHEAAIFGTACAAITVRKLHQTGYPTKQELLELTKEL